MGDFLFIDATTGDIDNEGCNDNEAGTSLGGAFICLLADEHSQDKMDNISDENPWSKRG